MARKRIAWLGRVALVLAGAVLVAAPARAETVVEAWRSPFGYTTSVARNPTDGTLWVASGASVLHLTAGGSLLSQTNGLVNPRSCAVAPDGSCWVALAVAPGNVVHLAEDGSELARLGGLLGPWEVAVSADGATIWILDGSDVVHLTATGAELWRVTFEDPGVMAVNPSDNSCWVADRNFWDNFSQLVHLDASGAEVGRVPFIPGWLLADIVLDPSDQSVWVCLAGLSELRHYSAAGDLLATLNAGVMFPGSLGFSAFDGALWVGDEMYGEVAKVATDGSLLYHGTGFSKPASPAPDPANGSCWFVEQMGVMHLAADGSMLLHVAGQGAPYSVSVSPADNSAWAGLLGGPRGEPPDFLSGGVLHVAANGTQLWFSDTVLGPMSVSANATDGTAWAVDVAQNQVVHLATDGAELWRGGTFQGPLAVAANPNDGSVWASDSRWSDFTAYGNVVHLSSSGAELARNSDFRGPRRLSVNTADNSVWVADSGQLELMLPLGFVWQCAKLSHLAADGSPIWEMPYDPEMIDSYQACSVNPADDSVWATNWDVYWDRHEVIHLAADGSLLWSTTSFPGLGEIAVNASDGTVWLTSNPSGGPPGPDQVVHLSADGSTELWRGTTFGHVESLAVNAADGSCWVADTGNGQLVHLVIIGPPTQEATRNAGYWATHPAALVMAFTVLTGSASGEYIVCGEPISANDAMAIFWEAQGQRAQLASQLIAAICNNALLQPAPDTLIADATSVLCDTMASNAQIGAMLDALGAYNDSGSALPIETFDFGGADIATAKAMAEAGTVPGFAVGL